MAIDNRRHILFINPRLTGGGAERVVVNLLRHFDQTRFKLSLAVVDMRGAVFLADIPPYVTVVDLESTRVRYALLKIVRLIRRTKPHVVFSTLNHMNVGLAMTRTFWPKCVQLFLRPTTVISDTLRENKRGSTLWRNLFRIFMTRADGIIFQSEALRRDFLTALGVHVLNDCVINNPVDIARVRRRASEPPKVELPEGRYNIVAAGRLATQKGFDTLLEAMTQLRDTDAYVTILGDGDERAVLKEMATCLGVADLINFAGFQDNPYSVLARANLFVLSSRYEGFPNVVLEALACGTPVVASALPGMMEILGPIPGCATFMTGDAGALSAAIKESMTNRQIRVATDAVDSFDVQAICKQYEAAFS